MKLRIGPGKPLRTGEHEEKQEAPHAHIERHADPRPGKSDAGRQESGRRNADEPDGEKIDEAGVQCVAGAAEHAGRDDRGGKQRLCERLDAETGRAEFHDLRNRREDAYERGCEEIEKNAGDAHEAHAENDRHDAQLSRHVLSSGADGLSDDRDGGGGYAVTGHVAEALGGDAEGIGGDGDRPERGDDADDGDLGGAEDALLRRDGKR